MPRIYSNFSEGKKEIAKRMKIADMEAATAKAERENGNCRDWYYKTVVVALNG